MTEKLETVLEKISTISNPVNSSLIQEFYQFMADNRKQIPIRRRIISRLLYCSAMNLVLKSLFTIFGKKRRYLNF
jgi:hypothetical protein